MIIRMPDGEIMREIKSIFESGNNSIQYCYKWKGTAIDDRCITYNSFVKFKLPWMKEHIKKKCNKCIKKHPWMVKHENTTT